MTRLSSFGGRTRVATQPQRERGAAGAGAGPVTISLVVSWLNAATAPFDGSPGYFLSFDYAAGQQTTIGMMDYAESSGSPVGLTVLTAGATLGPGPYTTDPVELAGDRIGAFVIWQSTGNRPSTIDHPDLSVSANEDIQQSPIGVIADYGDDNPGATVTAPFEIPDTLFADATAAAWVIFALTNCSNMLNDNTFSEPSEDERVLRWGSGFTDELLIGAIGRAPGPPVTVESPWTANSITVSA